MAVARRVVDEQREGPLFETLDGPEAIDEGVDLVGGARVQGAPQRLLLRQAGHATVQDALHRCDLCVVGFHNR